MLSDERITAIFDQGIECQWDDIGVGRVIEREAAAPLIERISLLERKLALVQQGKFDERMYQAGIEQEKQIKEDEALMRIALDALAIAATWMPLNHRIDRVDSPIESLRQRLEAKR